MIRRLDCMLHARWLALLPGLLAAAAAPQPAPDRDPAWAQAYRQQSIASATRRQPAVEARRFMRRLAEYVVDNHLKRGSEQRGMIYENLDVDRRAKPDRVVEGEAKGVIHPWRANGARPGRESDQV